MPDPSPPPSGRIAGSSDDQGDARAQADPTEEALNLASGVFRFARDRPDSTALVVDDRSHSYADLARAAARVAAWLRSRVRAEEGPPRVGILASRSFETYAGILGSAWAGATHVPLNPRQPSSRLASILGQARLSALLVDERGALHLGHDAVRERLPGHVLASDGVVAAGAANWKDLPVVDVEASSPAAIPHDHPAYVIFTSGTTGVPKGVTVTAGNVAHFLDCIRPMYGIGPDDRVGQFCEPSFDLSVFEIFAAWDGGASLHVVPETSLISPAGFIRREELTVWASVPSVITVLSRMKMLTPGMFPSLRASVFIGEALLVESAKAWVEAAPNSVVDNHYGPTEATVACTVQRVTDPVVETPGRGTVAIGVPYAGMEVDIVGADGRFLEAGETGELALHGPQVADGYLGDPGLSARRFPTLEHPRLGPTRWYLSGDLGFRDTNGVLHCLGRLDHQVKILGHRVELEDLEAHLRGASGSDEVAAVAWPLRGAAASGIVAFVCGASATTVEIRERLKELLPHYMVPRRVVEVDALPLSTNGKVDRKALLAMLEQGIST